MPFKASKTTLQVTACVAVLCAGALVTLKAQQTAPAGRGGGGRGGAGAGIFTAVDGNKDSSVTRDELKAAFAKWLSDGDTARAGALTQEQLAAAISAALPQPVPNPAAARGPQPQNQVAKPEDVEKMMAALPDKAPAKPKQPRKVLVLAKAAGFVHSCIPLAAKTMEALGTKTGAWTATVTYDPAAITEENLKQYDLLFLDNTTGAFLDDPNDAAVTAARRKALLDFVRGGKGLAGIHAASDSYHQNSPSTTNAAPAGGFGGRGPGTTLAAQMMAGGDKNADKKLDRAEIDSLADGIYAKLDTDGLRSIALPWPETGGAQ